MAHLTGALGQGTEKLEGMEKHLKMTRIDHAVSLEGNVKSIRS